MEKSFIILRPASQAALFVVLLIFICHPKNCLARRTDIKDDSIILKISILVGWLCWA